MSEDKLQKRSDSKDVSCGGPEPSRRRLLKKSVAIPVIMTLHSGAALARSSNLAGSETSLANPARQDDNNIYCMDHEGQLEGGAYDLGDSPTATLVSTTDAEGNPLSPDAILTECNVNRGGIIISAGAFSSISGRVQIMLR